MDILYIIYFVVVLITSIIFHEVAHGVVALKCGDTTAKDAGRLTLNPIPHVHMFGSIILPTLLVIANILFSVGIVIGWAKPVPINPYDFNKERTGLFLVSIAGIVVNFSIAITAALLIRLFDGATIGPISVFSILFPFVFINLALGFLNLLPIPPLDGSTVLMTSLGLSLERQNKVLFFVGRFFIFFLVFLIMPLILSGAHMHFFIWVIKITSVLIGIPVPSQ